jgi:hypothetical protein
MSRLFESLIQRQTKNLPSKPSMSSGFEMWQIDEYPGVEGLELKVHLSVLE